MADDRHSDHQYTTNRRRDSSETRQALSIEVQHALAGLPHVNKTSPSNMQGKDPRITQSALLGSPSQSTLSLPGSAITRVSPIPRYPMLVSQAPPSTGGIPVFQGHGLVNILPGHTGLPSHPGSLEALAQLQGQNSHLLLAQQMIGSIPGAPQPFDMHYQSGGTVEGRSISPQSRIAADALTQLFLKQRSKAVSPHEQQPQQHQGKSAIGRTEAIRIITQPNDSNKHGSRGPSPHKQHSPSSRMSTPHLNVHSPAGSVSSQSSGISARAPSPWKFATPAPGKPTAFARTASPGKPASYIRTSPSPGKPAAFTSGKPASYTGAGPSGKVVSYAATSGKPGAFISSKPSAFASMSGKASSSYSSSTSKPSSFTVSVGKPGSYQSSSLGKPSSYVMSSGKPASYASGTSKPVAQSVTTSGKGAAGGGYGSRTSPSPGKVIAPRGPSPATSASQGSPGKHAVGYNMHNSPQSAAKHPSNNRLTPPPPPPALHYKGLVTRVTPPPQPRSHPGKPENFASGILRVTPPPPATIAPALNQSQARLTPPPPPPPSSLPSRNQSQPSRLTPPPPPTTSQTHSTLPSSSSASSTSSVPPSSSAATSRQTGPSKAPGPSLLYSALASSKQVNGLKSEDEKENKFFSGATTTIKSDSESEPVATGDETERLNPYNMRISNLSHFPTSQTQRTSYRSHAVAMLRAKAGSITSPAKSLDLLRQNLQKFINKELDAVIQNYVEKYFKPGVSNIKDNLGEEHVPEDSINVVCATILEEAKKMYVTESTIRSITPDNSDNVSEAGSTRSLLENKDIRATKRSLFNIRKRRGSSDSEASGVVAKKRGRKPKFSGVSGRSTPLKQGKGEVVKREGEKWDPERLTTESLFVMGARANKALGLGAMRGRLYVKHPDLFKYCGDQDDKNWLHEQRHMPATGGKAYLLLYQDIMDLAESPEYKGQPGVAMSGMVSFSVPQWMINKMKAQMQTMRTDLPKQKVTLPKAADNTGLQDPDETDSVTTALSSGGTIGSSEDKLPFANFGETKPQGSPAASMAGTVEDEDDDDDDDDDDDHRPVSVSPFAITGGFGEVSPAPSDLDAMEEDGCSEGPLSAPFDMG